MAMKWIVLGAFSLAGCGSPLRYHAPRGFAEAAHDWRSAHYKASDNVGLKLLVFDNVEGGTLDYWGEDLVRKLRGRAYELRAQSAVATSNDVAGTRFDFVLERDDAPPLRAGISVVVEIDTGHEREMPSFVRSALALFKPDER